MVILLFLERIIKIVLVTHLKCQATKILANLRESKEAILITEHGQPSAYLVDVQDYEFMQRRLALLDALSQSERVVLEKRTMTHAQAEECMQK